jgi:hypothetical protein
MMRQILKSITRMSGMGLLAFALALAACADYKGPAQETLDKVQATLDGVAKTASKYAPDDLKVVQDELNAAKASFDKGDYEAALVQARQAGGKLPDLATTANEKKNVQMHKLAIEWTKLSADLPAQLDTIGAKLTKLGKAHNPPAAYAQAKTDFDGAKQTLTEATTASAAGDVETAVDKARAVAEKAKSIMTALGMKTT